MKRIFTIVSLVVLMVACDVGPRQASAYGPISEVFKDVRQSTWTKDGMEYHAFVLANYGGIFVVNHTKEKLDIKLKTLQIEKLKRELGHE